MSDVIGLPADIELAAIENERCELCAGIVEDFEELTYLRAADLIAQWEIADPRDAWRHTGEQPPRPQRDRRPPAQQYRPPQATVEAFLYVLRLGDAEYLGAWLDRHPTDAPYLVKLLSSEGK